MWNLRYPIRNDITNASTTQPARVTIGLTKRESLMR